MWGFEIWVCGRRYRVSPPSYPSSSPSSPLYPLPSLDRASYRCPGDPSRRHRAGHGAARRPKPPGGDGFLRRGRRRGLPRGRRRGLGALPRGARPARPPRGPLLRGRRAAPPRRPAAPPEAWTLSTRGRAFAGEIISLIAALRKFLNKSIPGRSKWMKRHATLCRVSSKRRQRRLRERPSFVVTGN